MVRDCMLEHIGLVLLFVALMISMILNLILFIRRRGSYCREKDDCCFPHIYEGEGPPQDEGRFFPDQQENPHLQQENPIYGNISTVRTEAFTEMMTTQHTRHRTEPFETDLNYASLDLKIAKKRKRKYQHQQDQFRSSRQDQLPVHLPPPMNSFLEVERDMDAHLPPRDTSTMVSHTSIYLNSQQIAQETEELAKERSMNWEREDVGWGGNEQQEDGGTADWRGEEESEERKDRELGVGNGTVCTHATQRDSDNFTSSICQDSDRQSIV
ncbi:uncharacterized protein LOC118122228 isoform X2 [Hippoglossus stenolepis]|uniref:uncharacterized protein LOC118122228 isoform X2 n=1 Tax=Hippoglossus stenolepis TaxID=195615 RepID=UPI00159BF4AD|nr:uncharacterized protein LOC118122228 isoform X2 [Hippoglossus stenolepis]